MEDIKKHNVKMQALFDPTTKILKSFIYLRIAAVPVGTIIGNLNLINFFEGNNNQGRLMQFTAGNLYCKRNCNLPPYELQKVVLILLVLHN